MIEHREILYRAERNADGEIILTANDKRVPLQDSLDVINHSPTGFEIGYGGSGAAQTALAILYHYIKNADLASRWHQQFKWDFVASAARDGLMITGTQIDHWLQKQGVN